MFTVLSNTRNSNLYLIVALAITLVVILSLIAAPSIAAPKSAVIPLTRITESSDYYQRHPELRVPGAGIVDMAGDFYLRHPEWINTVQITGNLVTGAAEASDYFQRHPEVRTPIETDDLSDYFLRH